ncbi:MAG: Uma2 family endonuclease [Acidobacteriota bacterium]
MGSSISSPTVTYSDFLAAADEDVPAEWVAGEIIEMSPASRLHQDLARFLTNILSAFVEHHALGVLLPAPFQMKLEASGREPDVLFVATRNRERLRSTYLDGPADLAIEIVSPESRGRDRGDKFYEYEQAGVREYWLIDPERERAEFYRLEDEIYSLATLTDGVFRSRVLPDLELPIAWLWQQPLPTLVSVLKEWKLV